MFLRDSHNTKRQAYRSGIVAGALLSIFLLGTHARAAENTGACTVSQDKLKELISLAKNGDSASKEAIQAELNLRKEILNQTITCASDEAVNLKSGLAALTIDDADIAQLRNEYTIDLDRMIRYYTYQKSQIGNLALYGSKQFAKSLKDWRLGTYNPPAQHAAHLIIWIKNQELLDAATAREQHVADTITLLKRNDDPEVKEALQKTKDGLARAHAANDDARKKLGPTSDPNDLLQSIKNSLGALADVYHGFADLADLIGEKK